MKKCLSKKVMKCRKKERKKVKKKKEQVNQGHIFWVYELCAIHQSKIINVSYIVWKGTNAVKELKIGREVDLHYPIFNLISSIYQPKTYYIIFFTITTHLYKKWFPQHSPKHSSHSIRLIDWLINELIDFNSISMHLKLFHMQKLGNHIHCWPNE